MDILAQFPECERIVDDAIIGDAEARWFSDCFAGADASWVRGQGFDLWLWCFPVRRVVCLGREVCFVDDDGGQVVDV